MSLAELLPRRGVEIAPGEVQATKPAKAESRVLGPAAIGGAVGAACGIGAAIVTVFVWNFLHPPVDLRLDPVAQRVVTVENSVKDLTAQLGPVQTELASFYDVTDALGARMDDADSRSAAMLDDFENALAQQTGLMSVGSPVFAVAVAQLRAAALSGRPFEAELLNVYALAANAPSVDDALRQLVNASRTGVPSDMALRQTLASAAATMGIGVGDRATVYDYGVSMLANYVGVSNESYVKEMARSLIARADAQLAAGDAAGAVETLRGVDQSLADKLAPWFALAQARVADDQAIATVVEVVRSSISDKLLSAGGAG